MFFDKESIFILTFYISFCNKVALKYIKNFLPPPLIYFIKIKIEVFLIVFFEEIS